MTFIITSQYTVELLSSGYTIAEYDKGMLGSNYGSSGRATYYPVKILGREEKCIWTGSEEAFRTEILKKVERAVSAISGEFEDAKTYKEDLSDDHREAEEN